MSKYTEIHSKTEKIRYLQQSTEQCELVTITVPDSFSQERKKWRMKLVFVLPEDRCCRVQPCTPCPAAAAPSSVGLAFYGHLLLVGLRGIHVFARVLPSLESSWVLLHFQERAYVVGVENKV